MEPKKTEIYLTVAQAAKELQVYQDTVYDMINSGRLPAIKLGPRQTRIRRSALDSWMIKREV
jgi:excisionase family DNA binding protein